jgi:hypothetical protein
MKSTAVSSKAILVVLLAAAVCVNAADTPTVTVKGYGLGSACALLHDWHSYASDTHADQPPNLPSRSRPF